MAVAQEMTTAETTAAKHFVAHPLCPLTVSEISLTSELIASLWPANVDLRYKTITLAEPEKKQLIPFLEAEHGGKPPPHIDRKAFVAYYIRNTVRGAVCGRDIGPVR